MTLGTLTADTVATEGTSASLETLAPGSQTQTVPPGHTDMTVTQMPAPSGLNTGTLILIVAAIIGLAMVSK